MTAQDRDLVALTDADYNNIRSSIYSPTIGPAVEVSYWTISLVLVLQTTFSF